MAVTYKKLFHLLIDRGIQTCLLYTSGENRQKGEGLTTGQNELCS